MHTSISNIRGKSLWLGAISMFIAYALCDSGHVDTKPDTLLAVDRSAQKVVYQDLIPGNDLPKPARNMISDLKSLLKKVEAKSSQQESQAIQEPPLQPISQPAAGHLMSNHSSKMNVSSEAIPDSRVSNASLSSELNIPRVPSKTFSNDTGPSHRPNNVTSKPDTGPSYRQNVTTTAGGGDKPGTGSSDHQNAAIKPDTGSNDRQNITVESVDVDKPESVDIDKLESESAPMPIVEQTPEPAPDPVDVAKDIFDSMANDTNNGLSALVSSLSVPSWASSLNGNQTNSTVSVEAIAGALKTLVSRQADVGQAAVPEHRSPVIAEDDAKMPILAPPTIASIKDDVGSTLVSSSTSSPSNESVANRVFTNFKNVTGSFFYWVKDTMSHSCAQAHQDLKRKFSFQNIYQSGQDMVAYYTGDKFTTATGNIQLQLLLWMDLSTLKSLALRYKAMMTWALVFLFIAYKLVLVMCHVPYEIAKAGFQDNFWASLAYFLKFTRLDEDRDAPSALSYFQPKN